VSFGPRVSIVVPSYNAAATIRQTLSAIRASDLPVEQYELIVVDDASDDTSATIAARHADTVVRLRGRRAGPAYARNRGADLARGEFVAFIDADVVIRPDSLSEILSIFRADAELDAISAARDDSPAATNFVSQYWNLLLHFGEQSYRGVGGDFASGCCVVRRSAFVRAGLYDEWRFGVACMEGLELGQRLRAAGSKVFVSQSLQVTHLSCWSPLSVFREAWNRSRVLARSLGYQQMRASVPSEVVFTLSRAMPPALAVVSIVALSGAFLPAPPWLLKGSLVLLGVVLANAKVYSFYARKRGLAFAIATVPLHLVVQAITAIALCIGWVLRDTIGDRSPDATTQAYAEIGVEMWPPVPRRQL
jgi:GT2 family glycosyltransferase